MGHRNFRSLSKEMKSNISQQIISIDFSLLIDLLLPQSVSVKVCKNTEPHILHYGFWNTENEIRRE